MVLRNQLSAARQALEQGVKRCGLIKNAWLLDALSITSAQFRAAQEPPGISSRRLPGQRNSWCSRETEQPIVFESSTHGVEQSIANIALNFERVAVVASLDRSGWAR